MFRPGRVGGARRGDGALRRLSRDAPAAGERGGRAAARGCARARGSELWPARATTPACTSACAARATASATSTRCRCSPRRRAGCRRRRESIGRRAALARRVRRRAARGRAPRRGRTRARAAPRGPPLAAPRPRRAARRAAAAAPRRAGAGRGSSPGAVAGVARARGSAGGRGGRRRADRPAAPSRDRRRARPPLTFDAADGLLRHHADLLRQRRAPPRARVHDDRRRHPRPPQAPARRGGVLPHRHRRARRAGRAGGRARGRHAEGTRRPQRRALQGADAAHQRHQRLLHPDLRPAPQAARPGGPAGRARQRARLQGHLRGLVLPALRGLQDRERGRRGQHLPDPQDPARPRARGELVLPPLLLPGAAGEAVRRAA